MRDEAEPTYHWCAAAVPVIPGAAGERRSWVSEAGVVHFAPATTTPQPKLDPAAGPPARWQALGE